MNDLDQQNQLTMTGHSQDEHPSTSSFSPPKIDNSLGADVEASHLANLFQNTSNQAQPAEIQSFNKYYIGEWSGAHQLYNLVMQSEKTARQPSSSPPTPSPPQAFGINEEPFGEEENMQELVNAFDDIILSQPTVSRDTGNDAPQNDGPDVYKPATSKTQEWMWEAEQMLEDETYPIQESDSAYAP